MKKNNTRILVQGAMMLSLVGVLVMSDTYTGSMFNMFLFFLMPLPFIVYGMDYGIKKAWALAVSEIILTFFIGLPETLLFVVTSLFIGLIYIYAANEKWDYPSLFLSMLIVCVIMEFLSVTVLASLFGYNIIEEYQMIASQFSIPMHIPPSLIIALMALMMGLVETYVFTNLIILVFYRLKRPFIKRLPFYLWRFSKKTGLFFISLLIIGALTSHYFEFGTLACLFSFLCLILQGISFVQAYCILHKKRMLIVPAMILVWVFPFMFIYGGLGLIDIFSEIRMRLLYNKVK